MNREDFRERHVSGGVAVGMLERDFGRHSLQPETVRNSLIIILMLLIL